MKQLFGASWRTSLMGYLGAAFFACLPVLQKGDFQFNRDWLYLVLAVGSAIFGRTSKDASVTHSTPQDTTSPKPTEETVNTDTFSKN